jgi:small subunit ribosomal protein S8
MSQDIIADTLNQMMNGHRAKKEFVVVHRHSKMLLKVLDIAQEYGYVKDYKIDGKKLKIELGKFMKCNSVKPRFNVTVDGIDKYRRRYLPARDMGILIISTNKGLVTHEKAYEDNLGGTLVAYFY